MDFQEINRIWQQHLNQAWPKFLESVSIDGLRGWKGERIDFHFPVVAIVGDNGTGKSTVLKSVACAYENDGGQQTFYPTDFFIATPWDRVEDVTLAFTFRHGNDTRSYNMKKPAERWSYPKHRATRHVYFLDIARTLPLDATIGYAKIAKTGTSEVASSELDDDMRRELSHVLGRDYTRARFAKSDADPDREVGLLQSQVGEVSQYHQGAGEDASLDLMRMLQSLPDTSLLIIDEVENSLHPRAQRRLIRMLLKLSRRKRIQVILSTHSPYILEELPLEGRVLLVRSSEETSVLNSVSTEFAMSRIDEEKVPEIHLFVEDREAKTLLRSILGTTSDGRNVLSRSEIVPVGPASVLHSLGPVAAKRRLPYAAVCVLDADSSPFQGCVLLPGSKAPERQVFDDLRETGWDGLENVLDHGAGELFSWLDEISLGPDHHDFTRILGDKLVRSRDAVWERLCEHWVATCLDEDERDELISMLKNALNEATDLFGGQKR